MMRREWFLSGPLFYNCSKHYICDVLHLFFEFFRPWPPPPPVPPPSPLPWSIFLTASRGILISVKGHPAQHAKGVNRSCALGGRAL
jgi:hypothetical protein